MESLFLVSGSLLLVVSFVLLLFALITIGTYLDARRFSRHGARAVGVCTGHGVPDNGQVRVEWTFPLPDGGSERLIAMYKWNVPPLGTTHGVVYDRRRPRHATLAGEGATDFTQWKKKMPMPFALGLGTLVAAIVLLVLGAEWGPLS
ncbi:DUF3592 domain-containing protein [Streptomyces sp. NPDC059740]|uniref:DUF3592 domain-containing protein n=1 Tax=Streptomyces sp. NPDC059740 TaxID=3346926 RepID=UPI00365968C3